MMSSEVRRHPPAAAAEKGGAIDGDGDSHQARTGRGSASGHSGGSDVGGGGRRSRSGRILSLAARVLAGVLIIAAAIAVAGLLVSTRHKAHQTPTPEVVRRVRTVEAAPRLAETVSRTWEGFGTARAKLVADVAAEVSGRVVMRPGHIDPGVAVSAGEVLVKLDEADYRERMVAAQSAARALSAQLEGLDVETGRLREQVAEAEEQVKLTRWEIDRLQEARAGAAASDVELVRLRSTLSRLEAERLRLQQQVDVMPSRRASLQAEVTARLNDASVAERQLERTSVVAPIAGVLQTIDANVGEMIQSGQRIARVVDLSRIEIPLRVPASAQAEIRTGGSATVRANATGVGNGRGATWKARVARVAPEADPQTRTITVFLEVEQQAPVSGNPQGGGADWSNLLMPGRFVSAELQGRAGNGEMLVLAPRRAIDNDRAWVAVEDESGATRAQPRQVRILYYVDARFPELDPDETQWAVIGAGIQAGEQVIVTNLDELAPGVRVDVVGG